MDGSCHDAWYASDGDVTNGHSTRLYQSHGTADQRHLPSGHLTPSRILFTPTTTRQAVLVFVISHPDGVKARESGNVYARQHSRQGSLRSSSCRGGERGMRSGELQSRRTSTAIDLSRDTRDVDPDCMALQKIRVQRLRPIELTCVKERRHGQHRGPRSGVPRGLICLGPAVLQAAI